MNRWMGKNINVETKWKDYFVQNWMKKTQVDEENNFSWVQPSRILVFPPDFFSFMKEKIIFFCSKWKKRRKEIK